MTKQNKLIERIETNLQIKYTSPRFVEERIHYLKQKMASIHPAINIAFEQNEEDTLKINIEGIGPVDPFLKTLDILLLHIREKDEMQTEEKYHSETESRTPP